MKRLALLLTLTTSLSHAQQPWEKMDYGPFLQSSVTMPWSTDGEELDGIVLKGLTLKLDHDTSLCFDTDLLRYAGAWTGGWLKLMGTPFDGTHRPPEKSRPAVDGKLLFATGTGPGCSIDGTYNDPRPEPFGPLPATRAKFRGLYLQGTKAVLSYTVGNCELLDHPQARKVDDHLVIVRSIRLSPCKQAFSLLVAELRNDFGHQAGYDGRPAVGNTQVFGDLVVARQGTTGSHFKIRAGRQLILTIPPAEHTRHLRIALARRPANETIVARALATPWVDPISMTKGGEARFPTPVETVGTRGSDDKPFALDTLELPSKNPWHSWIKVGGIDFFEGGKKAALCTWAGDVWTVEGIDDDLQSLKWRRFATGLFQPLGLKIVDEKIYALGRDQITRLHDLNDDGEADFYECFNNDVCVTPNFHEFCFGLETDPAGNFYFSKGAPLLGTQYFDPISRHNGCMLRVSADGKKLDRFATGLRAPNGMGVGPNGEVTCGDNEGIWTPVCRINWMVKGGFYGCHGMSHQWPPPKTYDPPLCWLPFAIDNSTGGQVWVPKGKWGSLSGQLLHLSYGKANFFHVLKQSVGNVMQGGVVKFPVHFSSGAMRGRFNPADGQLYVVGLRGWQTNGAKDGSFQRVRYTGKPMKRLVGVAFQKESIELTFSCKLDRKSAEDLENYNIEQWNYRWTENYGSDLFSVEDPGKKLGGKGTLRGDRVKIDSAQLSPDGTKVTLKTQPLQPVMQIAINIDIEDAEGHEVIQDFYGTINKLPN